MRTSTNIAIGTLRGLLFLTLLTIPFDLALALDDRPFFRSKDLSTQIDGYSLRFALTTHPRCTFGDRDAIALDLYKSIPQDQLLLSIEPLVEGDSFAPVVKNITRTFFTLDAYTSLQIPRVHSPILVGVFICKNSGEKRSCKDKTVIDINEVFKRHAPGTASRTKPLDKVYFFQPLVLDHTGVRYLAPRRIGAQGQHLKAAVKKELSDVHNARGAVVTRLLHLETTLRSDVLLGKAGGFQIMLPHFSKDKCRPRRL